MRRLTELENEKARGVLDRYTRQLHDERRIDALRLELELRQIWKIGYQALKGVMIDILDSHPEYAHLAAFYMENSNMIGVVAEFQDPLAKLYGMDSWYHDDKEGKRAAYWEKAFAVISQFDLDRDVRGKSILQISREINQKMIEHFLEHPDLLRSIDPRSFEELVAGLFDSFDYSVELTKSTRDGGRDIIAIGNKEIAASKYLIECKRYKETNKVDIQPVRSLYGVVRDEKATKGIIVTTSSFTAPAREFIDRHEWELEGRDFDGVLDWLKRYQKLRGARDQH